MYVIGFSLIWYNSIELLFLLFLWQFRFSFCRFFFSGIASSFVSSCGNGIMRWSCIDAHVLSKISVSLFTIYLIRHVSS